jgi:adenylosuccinate lyase
MKLNKQKNYREDKSTILLDREVIELLREAKEYERQTYNEIIKKIAMLFIEAKKEISKEEERDNEGKHERIKNLMEKSLSSHKIP